MRSARHVLVRVPIAALVLAVSTIPVRGELPRSDYRKFQKDAPEFVVIKVAAVKTHAAEQGDVKRVSVVVTAKVVRVQRSKVGLEKGDTIRIKYTRTIRKNPFDGPGLVPMVTKGKQYPAFLRKGKGKTFAPAAGGFTFQVVK